MLFNAKKLNTRKQQTNYIANLYRDCGIKLAKSKHEKKWFFKHSKNLLDCQKFMSLMMTDKLAKGVSVQTKVINRGGCKSRFCPNCQRASAYKLDRLLEPVLRYLLSQRTRSGKSYKYGLLFITPTIPNAKPTPESVKSTQNKYKNDINKFLNLPELRGYGNCRKGLKYKGRILGSFTKFEQTINHEYYSKWFDTINLHGHILAVVHGSYFHSRYYLKPKDWARLWQKACGNKYNINVEATYYKDENGKKHLHNPKALHHIVSEVSKYETKSQDFVSINKKYYPNQNRMSSKVLHPFYALVKGLLGQYRYIARGILRKLIHQYRFGFSKFNKYVDDNNSNTVYKYKTGAKFSFPKNKYTFKYYKFSSYEIAEYYCNGTLILGYKKLLKEAHKHGTTLHKLVSDVKHDKRTRLAKGILKEMHTTRSESYRHKHCVIMSYWKIHVLSKYYGYLFNDYMGATYNDEHEAYKMAINRMKNAIFSQTNIKNWLEYPSHRFCQKLYKKFKGVPKHVFGDIGEVSSKQMNIRLFHLFYTLV